MKVATNLEPVFVEFIPADDALETGRLYISMQYSTSTHLCASGCGQKVVLPLSPSRWQLRYDGEAISISPSVGNWDHACKSHYWIRNNRIEWAAKWDDRKIEAGRKNDQSDIDSHYTKPRTKQKQRSLFERLFK